MGNREWFTKLREIMETTQPQEIAQKFDAKLSSGEIFVFTPNGDLRKLSEGGHRARLRVRYPYQSRSYLRRR